MTTRETILQSIREALANGKTSPTLPEVPEVWKLEGKSPDELQNQFADNIDKVAGRMITCSDMTNAVEALSGVLTELAETQKIGGPFQLGMMTSAFSEHLGSELVKKTVIGQSIELVPPPEKPEEAYPQRLQKLNGSIVFAEGLLADTGTAIVRASTAYERLLCYLSPACIVIAKKSTIFEHLPHAWSFLGSEKGLVNAKTGEFLLVTGPSRTADIEKKLVLGVHGPRTLLVCLIENL